MTKGENVKEVVNENQITTQKQNNKTQKGRFTVIKLLLLFVIVGCIAVVGYICYFIRGLL